MVHHIRTLFATCFASLFVVSCATIDYRSIQNEFEDATRGDNLVSASKLNDETILTSTNYSAVLSKLSNASIRNLNARLQPNAWMLRSICEWRTGDLEAALESSQNGLAADPVADSRDKIVLTLLPALIIDSEVHHKWLASGKSFSMAEYQQLAKANYITAIETIADAKTVYGPGTPVGVKYYCAYQEWRLLRNWWNVITSVSPDNTILRQLRQEAAGHLNGKTPIDAAKAAHTSIPSNHPLHRLIVAQSGS